MRLTKSYSRLAVRPFPLTDLMKKIIEESELKLQEDIEAGSFRKQDYSYLWNDFVPGPMAEFYLYVKFQGLKDNESFSGRMDSSIRGREQSVEVDVVGPRSVASGVLYDNFWRDFKICLHHELIHAFDIKTWHNELKYRINQRQRTFEDKGWKNEHEESAYESETYYYFVDTAQKKITINDAIKKFINDPDQVLYYRNMIKKWGKAGWQRYLSRVYKSAEQAYSDSGAKA